MVLLCFVLDLRTLPPPLLKELKQCLLQLANLYSITPGKHELRDRIGLCYIHRNRISLSDELKIVYSPSGNFSLRDFHHAVTNLPADAFLPEMMDPEAARIDGGDVPFIKLFSEEILYSWGGKDIVRKVIFLSSCLLENINSVRMILTDAADKCVSVEFILLEKDAQLPTDASRNVQEFVNSISDLENSSLRTYHPDTWMLYGLVKRWLHELKNNLEEPLQAVFLFKSGVTGSVDRIFCNLFPSVDQIIDGFSPCKTCRCHGIPLDGSFGNRSKSSCSCPVTSHELRASDLIETAVKVGEHTILFLPSFQSFPEFQQVSAPINFNVIERTNLSSLSEGTIVGSSFVVTPSTSHEDEATSDETDMSELNNRVFQCLCQALHSLDQGLVCSSNCNMETMRMASFHCFYILQPSDKGPMLLRRLAGSEEILPFPDSIKTNYSGVPEEMACSVQTSLLKMDVRDYNPLVHERGFHQKLNFLVKESLQFGSVQPKQKEANTEHTSFFNPDPVPETKTQQPLTQAIVIDDSDDACLTEEWEQLIVEADSKMYSPKIRKTSVLQPLNGGNNNKQVMGEKTSRILERLEAPRQSRAKMCSPIVVNSAGTVSCTPKKKPLLPFGSVDVNPTLSQPMKPNFQRIKRRR